MQLMFPFAVSMVQDCQMSLERIETFLNLAEHSTPLRVKMPEGQEPSVEFKSYSAVINPTVSALKKKKKQNNKTNKKDKNDKKTEEETDKEAKQAEPVTLLHDLTANWHGSQLIGICGEFGSGKSSVLNAILGEIKATQGSVEVQGSVAYVSQKAWGLSGTVRSNILLNLPLDAARLDEVVDACCLRPDVELWADGLDTEIGQRGITLSGGQRARLAVARAVYSDADIYLFDDPLSAVDVAVARQLTDNLLCGLLKDKLRILVTHQTQFLDRADVVCVMTKEPNTISAMGSYEQLTAQGLLHHQTDTEIKDDTESDPVQKKVNTSEDKSNGQVQAGKAKESKQDSAGAVVKPKGISLLTDEKVAVGGVPWAVYQKLFKYLGGTGTIFIVLLSGIGALGGQLFFDVWLSRWIDAGDNQSRAYYPLILIVALLSMGGLIFGRSLLLRNTLMQGAADLHSSALTRMLHAPMSFFDFTPPGVLHNRFVGDTAAMDVNISFYVGDAVTMFLSVLGSIALVCL